MQRDPDSGILNPHPSPLSPPQPPPLVKDLKQLVSRPLRKIIQRPRPWGGDPGAALTGRGSTGRGRGSSPNQGGGAGPARGAARRGGGTAWSTQQLRAAGDPGPLLTLR